jgi:hypothetical protein
MKKIVSFLLFLFFICSCSSNGSSSGDLILVAESEGGKLYKAGPVSVLQLRGTHYQMGRQYGMLLKDDLSVLYNSMIITFSPYWTYERMKQIADAVYAVYPQKYKDILIGMAETSGLGIEKQIILNALEFIPKINKDVPLNCSGLAVWGDYTAGGPLIFGRNNDDAEKYKIFGKYTLVAVFNPTDSGIPTAIVNYAGAIYAPNGMNRNGIFLELNSGNAQAYFVDRPSIFVTLFSFLQSCSTQDEMNTAFQPVLANMSSIVNVADGNIAYSFECPVTGVKRRDPDAAGLMASTNHFIDLSWGIALPKSTDDSAVRRDNLLALANANKGYIDVEKMKQILDKWIKDGGATNSGTIFQIIAIPSDLTMWLKAPGNFDWQKVDLNKIFIR